MTKLRPVPETAPMLRVLLRRSKDEGQEFSLDTQRTGCLMFGDSLLRRQPPIAWAGHEEYVDDGIAGDDFLGRAGLRRMFADLRPGDVVVCRDNSRLGRDALETTLAVREIVRDRNARLFYYATGQEVPFTTAIDAAMTFVQGVGAQMELENIRSRTREALRSRVRQGRIAGGRCYGYTLVRQPDSQGRHMTKAVVNETEAGTIREIFARYLEGWGLKRIADMLNKRGTPSPSAGRRGTGSWSPGAIHEMLRRERYRGVYVHGLYDRVKRGGKRITVAADPSKVIRQEIPEWRIIEEDVWEAAQAKIAERNDGASFGPGPAARYALSGVGRCAKCQGAIGTMTTTRDSESVKAYGCTYHYQRGSSVCEVATRQPMDEVEEALAQHMLKHHLTEERVEAMVARVRKAFADESPKSDPKELEREIERLRAEQKKVAAAVAAAPDVPELVSELRRRGERIKQLEGALAAVKRGPESRAKVLAGIELRARTKLAELRQTLSDRQDAHAARDVYKAICVGGVMSFEETEEPRVWAIRGVADPSNVILAGDPSGI